MLITFNLPLRGDFDSGKVLQVMWKKHFEAKSFWGWFPLAYLETKFVDVIFMDPVG